MWKKEKIKEEIAERDFRRSYIEATLKMLIWDVSIGRFARKKDEWADTVQYMYELLEEEGFKNMRGKRKKCNHDFDSNEVILFGICVGNMKFCKKCGLQKFEKLTPKELFYEAVMFNEREKYHEYNYLTSKK